MTDRLPGCVRIVLAAFTGWRRDNASRMGASLAYYTLFALAPMLLIAIAVAGQVFGADAVRGEVVGQIDGLIGHEGAVAVQAMLKGAWKERSGALAAVIGGFTFLLTSTGAFLELQSALNVIWRVKPRPGVHLKQFLLNRAQSFGLVLAIGFLLLVSLVISAALAAAQTWLSDRAPLTALLWSSANLVASIAISTVLFTLLLKFLPDVELTWKDVWAGGLTTALLFTIGKHLIGLYIARSSTASSYGAAGSVLVLLLWVYYSAQILLLGAEFTRVQSRRRHHRSPPWPLAERDPVPPQRPKMLP